MRSVQAKDHANTREPGKRVEDWLVHSITDT